MIPEIESFCLVPHVDNIIECLKIPKFSHDPYERGPKMALLYIGWRGKLWRCFWDPISEHRGSGIPLLGITSLFMHKLTGLIWRVITLIMGAKCVGPARVNPQLQCD